MSEWELVIDGSMDVFDALAANRQVLLDAEVRELALIAQACDEYAVDESRTDAAAEKLITGGAEGTPLVGEFLALELAGLLQVSPGAALLRIRETLELRHRHPQLWVHTHNGLLRPWQALKVVEACRRAHLSLQATLWVDRQLGLSFGALGWAQLMRILPGLITSADPALAAERAAEQRARRNVYVGDHADGGSMLFARVDTEDALALNHTITQIANTLLVRGDTEGLDARRATALGMLADPHAAADFLDHDGDGRPTNRVTTLMVHIAGDCHALNMLHTPHRPYRPSETVAAGCPGSTRCTCGGGAPVTGGVKTPITCTDCTCGTATACPTGCPVDQASVARVDGIGAFDLTTLSRLLNTSSKVIVRPVVDWNTIPAVDAYEVPDRLREAITSRNPTDVFPYSARRADRCDMDHTIPYDHDAPPGSHQTRPDNLGPLSRRPHRAKTSRAWHVRQVDPSVYVWTSRHGFRYEVSPQGTIPLGRPPRPDGE